ncbi:MAG: 1-acyl-sn-glycerol-3-phosphate acyltransferase [Flavobacteriales bacterium]|nr:1-acyl-sn-glycerol-3-phosphate acyltransferase [Flavobacteriales bacterium]
MLYFILMIPFAIIFPLILVVFHPIQVIARFFGYQAHKTSVDAMIFFLLGALFLIASPVKFKGKKWIPKDRSQPLIVISNHQGMFDIPALGWIFRRFHIKFISKKKLAKGIPSVSYNIRHGGSIAIDRKKPEEAQGLISELGEYISSKNYAVSIFPEGTRSKDGSMKDFKSKGIQSLLDSIPNAIIVPVVLKNFWKIERYGLKPVPFFLNLSIEVLEPIKRQAVDEIIQEAHRKINSALPITN